MYNFKTAACKATKSAFLTSHLVRGWSPVELVSACKRPRPRVANMYASISLVSAKSLRLSAMVIRIFVADVKAAASNL